MSARVVISASLLCLGCMWCFVPLFLVASTSAIYCFERQTHLWNIQLCVQWDVKPYTLTHSAKSVKAEFLHQNESLTFPESLCCTRLINKVYWILISGGLAMHWNAKPCHEKCHFCAINVTGKSDTKLCFKYKKLQIYVTWLSVDMCR